MLQVKHPEQKQVENMKIKTVDYQKLMQMGMK